MSNVKNQIRTKVFIPDEKYVWIAAEIIDEGLNDIATFQLDEIIDDDDHNHSSFNNVNDDDKIRKNKS
jgi:hypothetical protein